MASRQHRPHPLNFLLQTLNNLPLPELGVLPSQSKAQICAIVCKSLMEDTTGTIKQFLVNQTPWDGATFSTDDGYQQLRTHLRRYAESRRSANRSRSPSMQRGSSMPRGGSVPRNLHASPTVMEFSPRPSDFNSPAPSHTGTATSDVVEMTWVFPQDALEQCPTVQDDPTRQWKYDTVLQKKHLAFHFMRTMQTAIKDQNAANKNGNENMPDLVMSTAMSLYHRFYVYQSMTVLKWLEMAWCCLFVAYKCEEKGVKMEWLLKWSHHIRCKLKKEPMTKLDTNSDVYWQMRDQLQYNERILLQTLGFDVIIPNASASTIKFNQILRAKKLIQGTAKRLALVAYKWSVASYGSELCLLYEPQVLACAFLYGAVNDLGITIQKDPNGIPWWEHCVPKSSGCSITITQDHLHQIMVYFYKYCTLRKEPRHFYTEKRNDDGTLAKSVVEPPKDPAEYGQTSTGSTAPHPAPHAHAHTAMPPGPAENAAKRPRQF